jgi:protein-disulfide isomerase
MKNLLENRKALYGGIALVAIGIAVALILVSVLGSGGGTKASSTTTRDRGTTTAPSTSTGPAEKAAGTAATLALFKGVPQTLNVLGRANAAVTMIEFADLQCPYCRDYTTGGLPALVNDYVRTGKAKFVFSGMHFIGPDSDKALRAVYAAGLQGHLWEMLDLLYKSQGAENSGWVTDALLRQIGNSIPGVDTEKLLADMNSTTVTNALAAADQQAQRAGVNSTPTFFAGPTGGTLQHIAINALTPDAFRPTLDSLTQ